MARLLTLAFRFSLLESSRYSPIPTQSSDVTTWLLSGLLAYHFSLALSQIHDLDKKELRYRPSVPLSIIPGELRTQISSFSPLSIIPGGNSDVQINWVTVVTNFDPKLYIQHIIFHCCLTPTHMIWISIQLPDLPIHKLQNGTQCLSPSSRSLFWAISFPISHNSYQNNT